MQVATNLTRAIEYFELAKNMGNMDAYFNLAMMKLGWMNPFFGTSFDYAKGINLNGSPYKTSPTTRDYIDALDLLKKAESMGHIQAKHRLAMMYSHGLEHNGTIIVGKSCPKALTLNREIAMSGTTISKRLRAAYKQYTAGNYDASLRNYLAAAETGSVEAQVNAAFLLEQGHCLGMNRLDCMKASVRMWRAAARQGDEEASLRVGDFYYYGRLREDLVSDDVLNGLILRDIDFSTALFPWIRYVLYPEDVLPKARKYMIKIVKWALSKLGSGRRKATLEGQQEEEEDYDCSNPDHKNRPICLQKDNLARDKEKTRREHFQIAANYYKKAAADHGSARANFNLGFMHEWGLGLTQDFPLAKRFYDIAATSKDGEGELAVQIALFSMNVHEFLVKTTLALKKWYHNSRRSDQTSSIQDTHGVSFHDISATSVRDIVLHHVFAADSLLIVVLIIMLVGLIQNRHDRWHRA
jgi:FOG: TPR repeat, SEL1 subfamily